VASLLRPLPLLIFQKSKPAASRRGKTKEENMSFILFTVIVIAAAFGGGILFDRKVLNKKKY
jgi:hypothetical protein